VLLHCRRNYNSLYSTLFRLLNRRKYS